MQNDRYSKLDEMLDAGGGYLLTSDVVRAGISKPVLAAYVSKRALSRVAHGVYFSDDYWEDELFLLSIKNKAICFSHETALYLHALMEREPSCHTVTTKSNYNGTALRRRGVRVYRVKDTIFPIGQTQIETHYGHLVRTYDRERTICDLISHKDNMEIQVFQTAMKEYMSSKDKQLSNLLRYAAMMGIEGKVRLYTEIML